MNRRNFLSLAALAIAGKAAERVFPFRVYSIPKEIVITQEPCLTIEMVRAAEKYIGERLGDPIGLYGIPAGLPAGYFDHVGPWVGINRALRYQSAVAREMTLYGRGIGPTSS